VKGSGDNYLDSRRTRPAIANERLSRNGKGQVLLQLKSPWRDGTTHIVMSPLEFMQRLAALVPRPRLHPIRFHGVLAPNAGLRAAIVPGPAQKPSEHAEEHAHASARRGWARLLKRVFDIDLEHCPQCGGEFRIIAAIGDCQDPHAPGLAGESPATLSGAADGPLPGGLILDRNTVAAAPMGRRGPRLRGAVSVRRNQPSRVDAKPDKPAREEDFRQTPRDSPLLGPGDTVAHGEKGGLNFLYAGYYPGYPCGHHSKLPGNHGGLPGRSDRPRQRRQGHDEHYGGEL